MNTEHVQIIPECANCGIAFKDLDEYGTHECAGHPPIGDYCEAVYDFTAPMMEAKLGVSPPDSPISMDVEAVEFICKMVNDELDELKEANSIAEQADALVDAIYYICDTAVRHGMNLDPIFEAVHMANMQKVQDGQITLNEVGKVMKPEGFKPPDIEAIINKQIEEGSW